MRKNILLTKFVFPSFGALLFAICFLLQSTTISAQELSPLIRQAVPQIEERLRSSKPAERIEILKELVYWERDYDLAHVKLRYENLPASDYSITVKSVFEFDLTILDEKLAAEAWWRINYFVAKFQLKEFSKTLAAYLSKTKSSVQYDILQILGALKAIETAPEIASLPVWTAKHIRDEALMALIKLRAKEAVPPLISKLYSKDKYERYYAVEKLVEINARDAAPHIAKLLEDEEGNNRYRVLKALINFKAHETAPQIWKLIGTNQSEVIEINAIIALVSFGEKRAIPLAVQRIKHILQPLLELKAREIVPSLIAILEGKIKEYSDINDYVAFIYALGSLKAYEAIPVLRTYTRLERGNKNLQIMAAQTLGELEAREAVDDLLPLLDKNATGNAACDVQRVALALAKIGERRTWKQLIDFAATAQDCSHASLIIIELNKHLDPEFWKKVENKKTVGKGGIFSIKEAIEGYSETTGIPIILDFKPGRDFAKRKPLAPPYKDTNGYPWTYMLEAGLLDALREIPRTISDGTLPQNFTFIFDDGRIQILTVDKAIAWWQSNVLKNSK